MVYRKTTWSTVEINYLKLQLDYLELIRGKPCIDQLSADLSKSKNAVKLKIKELYGEVPQAPLVQNKNRISKIGKRKDCDNQFFRSAYEANFFRFLKLDDNIIKIEYEPIDFGFWDFGYIKGTVSYTPDFKITYPDGSYNYVEVKGGFMKPQDKTKIKRFKKCYPEESSKLLALTPGPKSKTTEFFLQQGIDVKWHYQDLKKRFKNLIPQWE